MSCHSNLIAKPNMTCPGELLAKPLYHTSICALHIHILRNCETNVRIIAILNIHKVLSFIIYPSPPQYTHEALKQDHCNDTNRIIHSLKK